MRRRFYSKFMFCEYGRQFDEEIDDDGLIRVATHGCLACVGAFPNQKEVTAWEIEAALTNVPFDEPEFLNMAEYAVVNSHYLGNWPAHLSDMTEVELRCLASLHPVSKADVQRWQFKVFGGHRDSAQ